MAAFLSSAKYEGNNYFCIYDDSLGDGTTLFLDVPLENGSMCYTVQRIVQAVAALYFLTFIVTVNLIGSTMRDRGQTEDLGEDGHSGTLPADLDAIREVK